MFNFHKPKIYRSIDGCCICRAKSSSSRFTDSKRYEMEFKDCFRMAEKREGDICNACVLLVKRWKKLPNGTSRHWNHVVDARAGPGTKSSLKVRRGSPYKSDTRSARAPVSQHFYPNSPSGCDVSDQSVSDDSDCDTRPDKTTQQIQTTPSYINSFLDTTIWKQTRVCCGIIFLGPHGAAMIDPRLLKPCSGCRRGNKAISTQVSLQRSDSTDTESNSCDSEPTDDRGDNSDDAPGETIGVYGDVVPNLFRPQCGEISLQC